MIAEPVFTRQAIRDLDREAIDIARVPSVVLMENAGRNVAEYMLAQGVSEPVIICAGKGNNAGDGFVTARYLDNHQIPVRVFIFAKPTDIMGDAAIFLNIIKKSAIPIHYFDGKTQWVAEVLRAGWIVDALFGTGLVGPPKPPFHTVIQTINEADAVVVAIDIPSGLDCDTGQPQGATIKAQHTVTFTGLKKGFLAKEAKPYLGNIKIADIGIPRYLLFKK